MKKPNVKKDLKKMKKQVKVLNVKQLSALKGGGIIGVDDMILLNGN